MSGYLENHAEEVFNMLALEWNLDDALQARFADGVEDGITKVAVNMIQAGEPIEKIRQFTRLTAERINELADEIKKTNNWKEKHRTENGAVFFFKARIARIYYPLEYKATSEFRAMNIQF